MTCDISKPECLYKINTILKERGVIRKFVFHTNIVFCFLFIRDEIIQLSPFHHFLSS